MPKTITTTYTVYQFEELSDEAQARAICDARTEPDRGQEWEHEWRETLKRAMQTLPFFVTDWAVEPWRGTWVRVSFAGDDDVSELRGVRAWKWLRANVAPLIGQDGSCPWTGVGSDESLLDPLRAFLRRPDTTSTVADVLESCASSWADAWRAEIEGAHEDDYIRDELSDRDMLYLETGEQFHG